MVTVGVLLSVVVNSVPRFQVDQVNALTDGGGHQQPVIQAVDAIHLFSRSGRVGLDSSIEKRLQTSVDDGRSEVPTWVAERMVLRLRSELVPVWVP